MKVDEELECVICCEDIKSNPGNKLKKKNMTKYKLECGHECFHKACILEWINKNPKCPYCNYDIQIDNH